MINQEYVYCAVNKDGAIQWIEGSSKKTRYFKTPHYLERAVAYHNKYHPDDMLRIAKCLLVEVEEVEKES